MVDCAGRDFFRKKKQPIPVDLSAQDWAAQVARACAATYMFHTGGTSLNIRCSAPSSCAVFDFRCQMLELKGRYFLHAGWRAAPCQRRSAART
jgi:hypothetical protein